MKRFWQIASLGSRYALVVLSFITFCLCPYFSVSAYDVSECLVCHKDYGRAPEEMPENVSQLYIDQDLWEKDVHNEVVGLACDDCHTDATPETHPEKGLKKVDCAECHDEETESYHQTAHWTAAVVGEGKKKPDCADCHIPHATLSREEHAAAFNANLQKQCLSCHQEMEFSTKVLSSLLVFRVSAHRKSDISEPFDPAECINCHYTQAVGHGDNQMTENYCGKCHSTEATASGLIFGPFHLDPSLKNQPFVFLVAVLNILVLLGLLGALVFFVGRGLLKGENSEKTQ
jgi:hypothetical protein